MVPLARFKQRHANLRLCQIYPLTVIISSIIAYMEAEPYAFSCENAMSPVVRGNHVVDDPSVRMHTPSSGLRIQGLVRHSRMSCVETRKKLFPRAKAWFLGVLRKQKGARTVSTSIPLITAPNPQSKVRTRKRLTLWERRQRKKTKTVLRHRNPS